MPVRLDRWLHAARVYKTRSQATRACSLGRVRVNEQRAKAHRPVKVGDQLEIRKDREWTRRLVVRKLADRPMAKAAAREIFEDLTGPRPPADPWKRELRKTPAKREPGAGRPTKRERRLIDKLRDK